MFQVAILTCPAVICFVTDKKTFPLNATYYLLLAVGLSQQILSR